MPDPLSATLSALADPTRRAILARLVQGEATVNELAEPFEISLPAVSRHLKVLEGAGLISRGREAQWRPCKLEAQSLMAVDDWLSTYRRFYFGQKIMGTVFGAATMLSSVAMAFGPLAGGWVFDIFDAYTWLFVGSCAVGIGAVAVAVAFPPLRREGLQPA
jgi:DNA-binding transcriptional ArsR family regulator